MSSGLPLTEPLTGRFRAIKLRSNLSLKSSLVLLLPPPAREMPCALLPMPASRQVLRRAAVLAVPVLLGGLLLPAAVPAARAATCGPANLALNQPATASSTENALPGVAAVDGNTGTRWSSAFADPQWLEVDLGSSQAICQVVLNWETAYANAFQIQTRPTAPPGHRLLHDHRRPAAPRRCASPAPAATSGCTARRGPPSTATRCGSSRSTAARADRPRPRPAAPPPPRSASRPPPPPRRTRRPGVGGLRRQRRHPLVERGSATRSGSRSTSAPRRPSAGAQLTWETAYATAYQIQVSADGTTWTTVYSTTTGAGGTENLTFTGTGRYVRMYGTARATQYGYSLWEFSVLTPGGTGDARRAAATATARGWARPRRSPTASRRSWRR